MTHICRAIVGPDDKVKFESVEAVGTTIPEIILDDKKYGVMVPRNGKYFTFKVFDWQGRWITNKQITTGVKIAWNMIETVISIKCFEAKANELPDFKVYFRRLTDDPQLTANTLMYHFYPINNINDPNRGVCVVNADFDWTSNGSGIPLHIYDPTHYPKPVAGQAHTYDFDATYQHEAPGHGLGLPHSPNKFKKMSPNYTIMSESIFDESDDETILRLQAKYPKRILTGFGKFKNIIMDSKRWKEYFKFRRDHY